VPRHADEQRAVVAEVRRPPVLRVGHQRREIFLQSRQVEALELFRVVEVLAHGIGLGGMLVQEFELQLVRPPVAVRGGRGGGAVVERAFGFGGHRFSSSDGFDAVRIFVCAIEPTRAPLVKYLLTVEMIDDDYENSKPQSPNPKQGSLLIAILRFLKFLTNSINIFPFKYVAAGIYIHLNIITRKKFLQVFPLECFDK
jgi:hypothetical protein